MTVIIDFPRQPAAPVAAPTAAPTVSDAVLHELLRKAVVARRASEARASGSVGHRHHLAVSVAILDAVQIVMGTDGLAVELDRTLESRTTDIRKLARIARQFEGPRPA